MSERTKGEWKAFLFADQYFVTVPNETGEFPVKSLAHVHEHGEETAPNCRLMSAAPDLLAACQEAWSWIEYCGAPVNPGIIITTLQRAVAKAKGQQSDG